IDLASSLVEVAGLDAKFVCVNVYDTAKVLKEKYDVVFTSGGVITWLPDIERWAEVISSCLTSGGFFYIREFHPFGYIFDDDDDKATELRVRYPYFQGKKPLMFEDEGSYADKDAKTGKMKTYEWNHPISRIINALIKAGLRIDFFNEFNYTSYKALPFLIEGEGGRWFLPENKDSIPMMFSIKATKV
ncbi:MAG: SAM-dependent methyltransferase, partial [Candidatus Thorarchaeota archaeon]|nr:SAM-dependent methyltransferase [Candidatus Thorarchaeota archaeon]